MPNNPSTVLDPPGAWTKQVECCIEAFQAVLNRGERPALEDFTPCGAAAATVLVELVHVELEFRLKRGEPARVDEYLARYPHLAGDPDVFADLVVAEYCLRRRREPALRWDCYRERFPEHRDILAARRPDTSQHGGDAATLPQIAALERADLPRVPGYEIVSELGRGAMGVVYKARQIALHRTVALKMLHAARRSDAEQRRRFRNEVEIIARLQHPNIVQIHDVGEHDGRPFFAMEFLGGGSLADSYSGRPQPPRAAAELIETLARAMHAVHAQGIVHRDLKPSNVVRTADGSPKITDFGLARQEASDLTVSGEVLGTPCYMAPEQAAGRGREVGPAADVYALGALLYELLTGRPPFRGASVTDLFRQLQDSDPVAPRRMEPRTPRDLETICLKCLRKEPGRRYAGAAELADDLRRFQNGESILARPPAWPERVARWVRRRPAVAVLLAVAVLFAFVAPLSLLGHNFQLQKERDHAREAEEQSRHNETEAHVANLAADLKIASILFNSGDVFQLPPLLEPYQLEEEAGDDPRGFAWWYLRQHSQKARPALAAHDGPLHLLAYTPDGRELVAGGGGPGSQFLHVLDLETRKSRWPQSLYGYFPDGFGARAAYARRGALLAGLTKPREIVLWDFASPSPRMRFRLDLPDDVREIVLSPKGRWLAVRDDLRITIWDCGTGRKQCTLTAPTGVGWTFDPTEDFLVGCINSKDTSELQWLHATTGQLHKSHRTPRRVGVLSYSPRGTFLLLIGTDGAAAIWDAGQCVPLHWSHEIGRVRSLAMSPDEKTLAAGDETGVVRLWDVATCRWRARYRWQPTAIVALDFAPDNRALSAATAEGQIHQLDATVRHTPGCLAASRMRDGPLAWSADGETVAAAGYGGAVHLIDRDTARERLVIRCPFQEVRCLAFSPDGGTLATACEGERFVRLWNTKDGRQRAATPPQTKDVTAFAFHPDGRLATVDDKTVRFWDAADGTAGEELATDQSINTLAFSSNGRTLLTAGSALQVWDIHHGKLSAAKLASSVATETALIQLAITRDGRRVATAEANGPMRLWQLSADRKLTLDGQAPMQAGSVRTLDFTPDGKSVFVCYSDFSDKCSLWTPPARFCRINLSNSRGTMNSAALSPDGRTIATVGGEGAVRLWETSRWRAMRPGGQALGRVNSLTFSANGRELITANHLYGGQVQTEKVVLGFHCKFHCATLASTAESLRVWDAATGREQPSSLSSRDTMAPPFLVAGSPDGRWLAAGAIDGSIQVWDRERKEWKERLFVSEKARRYAELMETARSLMTESDPKFHEKSEPVAALTFSPDGRCLAALGSRGSLRVWTIEGGTERSYRRIDRPVSPWITFTPDGRGIVGSRGGQVCVWDARTGELRTSWGAETDPTIYCGAFLPGADVLALGSKDGVIRLWDRRTGERKRLPGGHQDRVTSLAFAADGKTLASGGWDRTVRLWNMRAGREVAVLEGHKGRINAVAFSPDGIVLASAGDDGEFRGEVLLWRR